MRRARLAITAFFVSVDEEHPKTFQRLRRAFRAIYEHFRYFHGGFVLWVLARPGNALVLGSIFWAVSLLMYKGADT